MAQLARNELGLEQVTVLAIDNAFGHGVVEVFRRTFRGTSAPTVFTYPPRGADYRDLVERAEETRANGIYLVGYYNDMTALLEEIRAREVTATILATSSIGSPRTLEMAGDTAEGVIFPATVFDPESEDPTVAAFVKKYRARYQEDPDLWAAHGYDAVMVAAQALREAEGPAPDRIAREILAIQEYRGPSGTLSFDQYGDVVQYPRAFIVHHGRFELYRDYLHEMKQEKEGLSPPGL
jgi:branched-chain amino acid transport system substrate-binding protein